MQQLSLHDVSVLPSVLVFFFHGTCYLVYFTLLAVCYSNL